MCFFSFYIDDVNKIAWHEVAKAASTTIKTWMVRVARGNLTQVFKNVHQMEIIRKVGIKHMECTPAEAELKFRGYTTLLVVRNPMTRLMSAYNDKMKYMNKKAQLKEKPYLQFKEYLQKINSSEATKRTPSINTFLAMIVSGYKVSQNPHWFPYFIAANPCYIQYDYILKVESLNTDLPMFIKNEYMSKYQVSNKSDLKLHVREKVGLPTGDIFIKGFTNTSQTLLEKVWHAFSFEASFFGYEFSSKNNVASCWLPEYQCC